MIACQCTQTGVIMICPKCGSNHVSSQAVTENTTIGKTKGFGWIKACIGFLLFSFVVWEKENTKPRVKRGLYIYVKTAAITSRDHSYHRKCKRLPPDA